VVGAGGLLSAFAFIAGVGLVLFAVTFVPALGLFLLGFLAMLTPLTGWLSNALFAIGGAHTSRGTSRLSRVRRPGHYPARDSPT
jgi:hypothetical protein